MHNLSCYTEEELVEAAKLAAEGVVFGAQRVAKCMQSGQYGIENMFFTHAQHEWRQFVEIHNELQARIEYYETHKAEVTE